MKNVEIDPAIASNAELFAGVSRANNLLEAELGRSAGRVSADWRLVHDEGRRAVLELAISNWAGRVATRFTPDELADERHFKHRITWLWGDLLQIESGKLVEQLQGAAATVDEGA